VTGPLNPVGATGFTPTEYTELHALLGNGTLPTTPPEPSRRGRHQDHGHAVG
jgi:hypothetical protein